MASTNDLRKETRTRDWCQRTVDTPKYPGLGDIYQAKERGQCFIERKKSTRKWYTQLNNDYGQVTLIARTRGSNIEQLQITMDPMQSQAIVFAKESLESKGEFRGLPPLGNTTLWRSVYREV